MPWRPLPRIAFAVAIHPFQPSLPADLPLELGDELYIIEEGGVNGSWYRGYLVAPPSLLAGLTCIKGQTLEARVFSGIFPRNCVEIREILGDRTSNGSVQETSYDNGHDEESERPEQRPCETRDEGISEKREDGSLDTEKLMTNGSAPGESHPPSTQRATEPEKSNGTVLGISRRSQRSLTPIKSHTPSFPLTPVSLSPRESGVRRPPAPVPMLKIGDETPTSSSEPLVDEIASCLREWHSTNLHELLLSRQYSVLDKLSKLVNQLDLARRQLLHGVLTRQELELLREKTVWDLVSGNKMLSNEVIVRDPKQKGRLLTGDDTAIEISMLQSSMSLLDKPPVTTSDHVNLHHLLVEFKGIACQGKENPSLLVSLFSKSAGEPPMHLTECFAMEIPAQDQLGKTIHSGKLRTLFSDLTSTDIGEASGSEDKLYVVIKVQASRLTQPASLTPSRTATLRDSISTKDSGRTNGNSTNGTPKSGRRSLLWGQTRLGKTQGSPSPKGSKLGQSRGFQDSNLSIEEEEEQDEGRKTRPATAITSRESDQQGPQYVKKSVGVAVCDLKHFFAQEGSVEQILTVWSPNETSLEVQDIEKGWDEVIHELLDSKTKRYEKSKLVNRIRLQLHSFVGPDADSLIRKTPTLFHNISRTPKIAFSGAPTAPRSDIYITLSQPHLPAQALFSHPDRGAVQLATSLDMHNVQLTVEVRKGSGERIEHCIFPSSNSTGLTAWRTIAIERGESWNQTIKLVIPSEDVADTHLIMSVADTPGFPFALAWMPLWDQHAFIKDGQHSPLLYLYDGTTSRTEMGRGAYLDFQWNSRARDSVPRIETLTGPVAVLRLKTFLCSTAFSQDQVLLGVLKWREQPEDQLLIMLRQLVFVPEIEIVKVVSDVFDALFSILVDRSGNDEYEDLVFNDLVTVLGIVHDRRFNLGPLVNEYTENKFNYPFATPCLIRSYLRLLSTPADYQNSRNLRATFKVGQQILKFIVTARRQQRAKEASIGITNTQLNFNSDFKKIFAAFESLIKEPSPALIGSKTLIVQHMHAWLPELSDCFAPDEIARIAVSFIDACSDVQGKLILHKLILIHNLTKAMEHSHNSLKAQLEKKIASWIAPYWGLTGSATIQYKEQVHLCSSIAATQIHPENSELPEYFTKIIQSYRCLQIADRPQNESLMLLFPTMYPFQTKTVAAGISFDENLIELSALLAGFSAMPYPIRENHTEQHQLTEIISSALEVSMSLLSGEAFPSSWLTLYVYHHRAVLKRLESIYELMEERCLPSPDEADSFDTGLWKTLLTTLLKLVRSEALALETFPEQKRRAVWKIAGDVREQGAALLERSWDAIGWEASTEDQQQYGLQRLGGFQVQYVPSLVGPIVELCMSVHAGLRAVAVKILQSMIVSEWTLNEDLGAVQAEMIDCLDQLCKSRDIGEVAQQKLFVNELLDLFEPIARSPSNRLWEAIKELVSTVDELLDLLVAVHSTDTTEAFRIMHTLRLMDFLKGMQKEAIYIRYVHQLADVQARARNATEAGLALRLHADLYTWDTAQTVEALSSPTFPKQSAFERKEALYFEMIRYFEEGAAWDTALTSYRELAEQYEHVLFDFAKLARTHRSTAKIFEIVARGEGISSRYFRVMYRGLGFPLILRDKQFIFEGHGSERLTAFTDRLQQQYPAAQLVPTGEIDDVEGQFLQVSALNAYRDLQHPLYQRSRVPQSTRDFILSSQPNRFTVTSRRHSPKHSVKDQWIEKTIYTTAETFPTILRRSEIISIDVTPLSPLQTAVERTTRKTSELAVLEKRIIEGDESSFFNMTDAIKSSVNPDSTTSVAQYRELLPQLDQANEDDDEKQEEMEGEPSKDPQSQLLENALKIALLDFASTLRRCLTLYTRPSRLDTLADFSSQFASTFAPELAVLAPPIAMTPSVASPTSTFAFDYNPTTLLPDPTSHLSNGHTHPNPLSPDRNHFIPTTEGPASTTTRSRFSSFLKRSLTSDGPVRPTNGFPSHQPELRSVPSSRHSSPSRNASHSHASTREADSSLQSSRPGSLKGMSRERIVSDARPVTAQSALTANTVSTARGASLRKRLSGFALGRKVSTPRFGGSEGVLREE
ncbi:hypothetical protein MMC34_002474 [Xylographa carneopallida]|nr:hypothetical protein [Xylographa carneopallida]